MGLYRLMNDGVRAGTKLGQGEEGAHIKPGVNIPNPEADRVKKILQWAGEAEMKQDELSVEVRSMGSMFVTLRKQSGGRGWYLNLDGNPLKYLRGRNVYGYPDASKQTVAVFKRCLKALEKRATENARKSNPRAEEQKFPESVWSAVERKDIYLFALEFATYTHKLENKHRVLDAWKYLYRRTNLYDPETQGHKSLADLLRVKFMEFPNSIVIASMNSQKSNLVVFSAYDKEREVLAPDTGTMTIRGAKKKAREDAVGRDPVPGTRAAVARGVASEPLVPDDIKDRLRLEICLTRTWFNDRNISTLADLERYMERNQLTWEKLAQKETDKIMEQACLIEMFKFDGNAVLAADRKDMPTVPGFPQRLGTDVWMAMLDARLEMFMTREQRRSKLDPQADKKAWLQMMESNLALGPMKIYKLVSPEKDLRVPPHELEA